MGNISSSEVEWDGIQLSNTMHLPLEDDLDKAEKRRVNTLNELVHNLMSALILEI
jgi:hypothetical protein